MGRYHIDPDVDRALEDLGSAHCAWERRTGRRGTVLFIPVPSDESPIILHNGRLVENMNLATEQEELTRAFQLAMRARFRPDLEGVELLLEPGVSIPATVMDSCAAVVVTSVRFGNRNVVSLQMERAEAFFVPGGGVDVRVPGAKDVPTGFEPLRVLAIRKLSGEVVCRNNFLCPECLRLTGRRIYAMSAAITGHHHLTFFECQVCSVQWTVAYT